MTQGLTQKQHHQMEKGNMPEEFHKDKAADFASRSLSHRAKDRVGFSQAHKAAEELRHEHDSSHSHDPVYKDSKKNR